MSHRRRPLIIAALAMVLVWVLAFGGYLISKNSKMTAEKLRAFIERTDFSKLSGEARAKALRELAAKINALSPEERQRGRIERLWNKWFEQMTEEEKGVFIEATMPTGFKQMLTAFEQLPPEKRNRAITNAVHRLKEVRENAQEQPGAVPWQRNKGTNQGPVLSEDLQKKVTMIGLKSVYTDSSAQTKAELAPLLEEIQKNMEAGRLFRNRE